MSLPFVYAIVGALAFGAIYTSDDYTMSKKDWLKYVLSVCVIVISSFLVYLAHIGTLTVRTCIVGEVVLCALFLSLAMELKQAQEGSPPFVHWVYVLSAVMCGIAGVVAGLLYYGQRVTDSSPFDTVQQLVERLNKK
jgi:hypothetical protein